VGSLADLRLAPFHLLASEGAVHVDKPHAWHLEMLGRLHAPGEPPIVPTPPTIVELTVADDRRRGVDWWREVTERGGEGIVVKPAEFVARGRRGLVQPALKCRGPEYLRIIYGPEYSMPEHLERLRALGLSAKRSLALREFALGIEALERFGRGEPLHRVHECVFGVLALESEPVDSRL
jgi:PNKP (polynucleotide 5'-kinase/3'-phosphatase) family adenylyltransferase-like protein